MISVQYSLFSGFAIYEGVSSILRFGWPEFLTGVLLYFGKAFSLKEEMPQHGYWIVFRICVIPKMGLKMYATVTITYFYMKSNIKKKTYVLITHHLLRRNCSLNPPYWPLVNVHIERKALEATQQEHHRDGQHPGKDHGNGYAENPGRILHFVNATL